MDELENGSKGSSMCGVITDFNAGLLAVGAVGWAAMTAVIGLKAALLDAKGKVRSKAGLAQLPARLTTSTRT
jgi:hypothetical protein